MEMVDAASFVSVAADHAQDAFSVYGRAEPAHNSIEEAIKVQDAIGVFVLARIQWIAGIAIAPEKVLDIIQGIQLDKEEIPPFARKKIQGEHNLALSTLLQGVAERSQLAGRGNQWLVQQRRKHPLGRL